MPEFEYGDPACPRWWMEVRMLESPTYTHRVWGYRQESITVRLAEYGIAPTRYGPDYYSVEVTVKDTDHLPGASRATRLEALVRDWPTALALAETFVFDVYGLRLPQPGAPIAGVHGRLA